MRVVVFGAGVVGEAVAWDLSRVEPVAQVTLVDVDAARLHALPEGSIVMHPGPMNRGLEISADAADSPRSTVLEQVANGVSVRMAALYLLLAGERNEQRDTTTQEDAR